nr:hypothetical protein [uncultured bacterium]
MTDPTDLTRASFRALNSVVKPIVEAGAGNPLPLGMGAVVLETVGRKSGLPREVPLLANRVGNSLVVTTVRGNSLWIKNIEANPKVAVQLFGERREGTACVRRGPLNIVTVTLD